MEIPFIDLKTPCSKARDRILTAMEKVLDHGQFVMGPEIATLENLLAGYVGVKHCVSVSSGTDSLEIALRALGIGPGDEVITVPFTWISTAEVISLVGATPVFVDIEEATYNLDPNLLEAAISSRTKAVIPVGLFGQAAKMEAINRIAGERGISVIEDAAQSFGATRDGVRSCALAPIASTSFFPAKPLGCYGDGGALFTDDDAIADTFRAIRNHGGLRRHHHTLVGMNGRFDTLQAAIMIAKWEDFPAEVAARERIGARYTELLREYCAVPEIDAGNTHVYAQYTIRVPDRVGLGDSLRGQGIPTAVYYPVCLHVQPVFADLGYAKGDFLVSEKMASEVISLPMHPYLDSGVQDRIVDAVRSALQ